MKLSGVFKGPSGVLIGLGLAAGGALLVAAVAMRSRPRAGDEAPEASIPDPAEVTVAEIRRWLGDTDDPSDVRALLQAERSGPKRKTALRAIESRLSALAS